MAANLPSWLRLVLLCIALIHCHIADLLAAPVTSHPRLWLNAADLPKLRSWAVDTNPLYLNGLARMAASAKADMDQGLVPGSDATNGGNTYVDYPAERYAELFAFMSLVAANQTVRDDYAQRARTLLMYIINRAAQGAAEGQPYRDPAFSINDRSRWHGEGFALTVDWIYPYLSATDKATIRTVFLRWISENLNAAITGHDHPEPLATLNSLALVTDPTQVRWSLNNYWTAHMRNIGQMALSFDAADDPGNTLRDYLTNATGAWLYVLDYGLRHDAQGGLVPEGLEYGPQTLGFAAQFLLSLHTSGISDTAAYGSQISIPSQPFWNDLVTAHLHSASPRPTTSAQLGGAAVYLPAWYGDGGHYYLPEFIEVFGPLGLYYAASGNTSGLNAIRWIQTHTAPGGASNLSYRANSLDAVQKGILYFLLFDPVASAPTDPRAALALTHFAPGMGRILARTDWSADASWFTYKLSWNQVDHQYGDGNQFEFYRKGEWLTKERTGYDLDYGAPQNHNTLGLENDVPAHNDACAFRNINYLTGAQWAYTSSGNPELVARSFAADHVYALGDATNLYNSLSEGATDILHASRSILWLKPDILVVYDRATSRTANRFKRFWLNTPTLGSVNGTRTTVTTGAGQKLYVSTLLPATASIATMADTISTCPSDTNGFVASDEPMAYRLMVEATGGGADARFLHVLQGTDGGVGATPASLIQSSSGNPFSGALIGTDAILFPVRLDSAFNTMSYSVPVSTSRHFVTGLQPGQGYTVAKTDAAGNSVITISQGGTAIADGGGVLRWGSTLASAGTLLNLIPGWNLLGNSVDTSMNVATAFGDASKVSSVWKWNPTGGKWAFYTPTQADAGAAYASSKGYDVLGTINSGEGLWVNAIVGFTAQLPTGTALASSSFRTLPSGWNLLATGDNPTASGFNNALGNAPSSPGTIPANINSLWAWDATSQNWYFYAPSLEAQGASALTNYIGHHGFKDFTSNGKTLGQGTGFWVNRP